jgi:hypothetical protein
VIVKARVTVTGKAEKSISTAECYEEDVTDMAQFEQALKQLVEDPTYRGAVVEDWNRLTKDYRLETHELMLLMQVWQATGRDADLLPIMMCHCCCAMN